MQKVNKMKDREFYAKLVFGARWKKVDKFLASGELEEKTTIMEAFGAAAKGNDECYNHLVEAVTEGYGAAGAACGHSGSWATPPERCCFSAQLYY